MNCTRTVFERQQHHLTGAGNLCRQRWYDRPPDLVVSYRAMIPMILIKKLSLLGLQQEKLTYTDYITILKIFIE